jgi:hypothetical protein
MRIFTIAALTAAVAAVSLVALGQGSNLPTKACGSWEFSGQGHSNGGALATVRFNFTPTQQKCGVNPCVCPHIAYIQVIRVRDMDNSRYIQPFEEQEDRMIESDTPELDGWAVDRLSSNGDLGYFKAIQIDTTDFDPVLLGSGMAVGSNASTPKKRAKLEDMPERFVRRVRFEAISAPVCLNPTGTCGNKLLGFRTWKFRVQDNLHGTKPTHAASTHWERVAVTEAIAKWNLMAPGAALQAFPNGVEPLSQQ